MNLFQDSGFVFSYAKFLDVSHVAQLELGATSKQAVTFVNKLHHNRQALHLTIINVRITAVNFVNLEQRVRNIN